MYLNIVVNISSLFKQTEAFGIYRVSLSANKFVNQQVMRFTPFITPPQKKNLGISCMVYCGTMSGILFLRIIQSY